MAIPKLDEQAIKSRANTQSWSKGESLFGYNNVDDVVWRDGVVTAEVQGSQYEPYTVEIKIDGTRVVSAFCSCPYDWGGDCKHIVATFLHLLKNAEDVAERQPMEEVVAGLDAAGLRELLVHIVEAHPKAADTIDHFMATKTLTDSVGKNKDSEAVQKAITINTDLLRRQIKGDLREVISDHSGYDSWGEEAIYDADLAVALVPAENQIRELLDAGHVDEALLMAEAAAEGWDDGIESLDEYVAEIFYDQAGDFVDGLANLWAEAILSADLDEAAQKMWGERLEDVVDTSYGGGGFKIVKVAAEHHWNLPQLVAAMNGEKGASEWVDWHEDYVPHYGSELETIRLRILEKQGRYDEYLNLARAEDHPDLYAKMLVKMGRGEEAAESAIKQLTSSKQFLSVAQTFAESNQVDGAIQVAKAGLERPEEDRYERNKAELAEWLRDYALEQNQRQLAEESARIALTLHLNLDNYKQVIETASDWSAIRADMLKVVANGQSANDKIDIYLHEGMHDAIIEMLSGDGYVYYDVDKVVNGVAETHPKWAFRQCRKKADQTMDGGKAKYYHVAAEWLKRGRDILRAAGHDDEWRTTIEQIMDTHARKRKLMPMLRQIEH